MFIRQGQGSLRNAYEKKIIFAVLLGYHPLGVGSLDPSRREEHQTAGGQETG